MFLHADPFWSPLIKTGCFQVWNPEKQADVPQEHVNSNTKPSADIFPDSEMHDAVCEFEGFGVVVRTVLRVCVWPARRKHKKCRKLYFTEKRRRTEAQLSDIIVRESKTGKFWRQKTFRFASTNMGTTSCKNTGASQVRFCCNNRLVLQDQCSNRCTSLNVSMLILFVSANHFGWIVSGTTAGMSIFSYIFSSLRTCFKL